MRALLTSSVLLVVLSGNAAAQVGPALGPAPAVAPGLAPAAPHERTGFYFRGGLGISYFHASADSSPVATIKGLGAGASLSVGYAVMPNLVIALRVFDNLAEQPTVTIGDATGTGSGSAGQVSVGGEVVYWLPGQGLWLAGAVGASKLTAQDGDGNKTGETQYGIGGSVSAGLDMWLSSEWAWGPYAEIFVASMNDKDAASTPWTAFAGLVGVCFTYL